MKLIWMLAILTFLRCLPASAQDLSALDMGDIANEASEIENRSLIFQTHNNVLKFLNATNLAQLKGLRACLCLQEPTLKCQGLEEKNSFERTFINSLGNEVRHVQSCEKAVNNILISRVQTDLEELRISLALSAPKFLTDQPQLFIKDPVSNETFNIHPSHPFGRISIAPLSKNEIRSISQILINLRNEICESYIRRVGGSMSCYQLANRNDSHYDYNFASFIRSELNRFRLEQRKKYLDILSANPLVLNFEGNKYSPNEMLGALDKGIEQAMKRLVEPEVQSERSFYLQRWALPYTQALLRKDSTYAEKIKQNIDQILRTGERHESIVATSLTVGAIGSLFLCNFIPSGRAVKLAMQVLTRGSCYFRYGLAQGGLFTIQEMHHYQALLDRFLSTYEFGKNPVKTTDLLDQQMQVHLAILTLPLAVFAGK